MAPRTTIGRIGFMPDKEWKINVSRLQSALALIACTIALVAPWLTLPQKIAEAQRANEMLNTRLGALEASQTRNRELIIRIDERVEAVMERLGIARKDGNTALR
jgi:hypothetical protein